jgi:hypothetical protein
MSRRLTHESVATGGGIGYAAGQPDSTFDLAINLQAANLQAAKAFGLECPAKLALADKGIE